MRAIELSIEGNNYRTAIRDAVLEAIPEECRDPETGKSCEIAQRWSYDIGQLAAKQNISPQEAAQWAWGDLGMCCRSYVGVELLDAPSEPSDNKELEFV